MRVLLRCRLLLASQSRKKPENHERLLAFDNILSRLLNLGQMTREARKSRRPEGERALGRGIHEQADGLVSKTYLIPNDYTDIFYQIE